MTNVTFDPVIAAVFFSVGLSFLAIIFAIVNRRRIERAAADYFGDPTSYTVVTDGNFYRVRGPFDTFYTARFRDKSECEQYAKQLADYHRDPLIHDGWRPA